MRLAVAGVVGVAIGAAITVLVVGGGSKPAATTDAVAPFTLSGTLTVPGMKPIPALQSSRACLPSDGYDDITPGTMVTVYDAAGQVVATGSLGNPSLSGYAHCDFPVNVPTVPSGSKFFQVEIGHRGKLTATAEQAKSGGFAATLGS